MIPLRALAATAAALAPATAAGCGFGPGEPSRGEAELRVTRDYGSEVMLAATESDPAEGDTVMRMLDREAQVETRYGGGFVQAIDGVEGGADGGRRVDWFLYVNGVESPVGAADVPVRGGDRLWWDHRDWTDAMRVPAVVGSYPEPFVQRAEGSEAAPVAVECASTAETCEQVEAALGDAGAEIAEAGAGGPAGSQPRVLVGPWSRVRPDPTARLVDDGPGASGVFARFEPAGSGYELAALDPAARTVERHAPAGLVAALRPGEAPPVWIVTGTDPVGLAAAVGALDRQTLRDRYAVAVTANGAAALPETG